MVRIKPLTDGCAVSEPDGRRYPADAILWQGIHVCAVRHEQGRPRYVTDLPIGHSAHWPYTVDLVEHKVRGDTSTSDWLWRPLRDSLLRPSDKEVGFTHEVLAERNEVIVLNCLDMMYGHCLLKLLNAERHLTDHADRGLVVLVPSFLRWLVPEGVAEIWSVDLRLSQMSAFHRRLHDRIAHECDRFRSIWLSEAYSHPTRFHIENFTRVAPHVLDETAPVVSFVWRDDRLWMPEKFSARLRRLGLRNLAVALQNRRVCRLFRELRRLRPEVICQVAGLGTATRFPSWIRDERVSRFSAEEERRQAELCARNRIVIGVHGSSMLLPSGLAGMTIDLMPPGKWDCVPEDILFNEPDPRMATFRYRFVPLESSPATLATLAASMLKQAREIPKFLFEDRPLPEAAP